MSLTEAETPFAQIIGQEDKTSPYTTLRNPPLLLLLSNIHILLYLTITLGNDQIKYTKTYGHKE